MDSKFNIEMFKKHMAVIENSQFSETQNALGDDDKSKLTQAYVKMYQGLTMVNWTRGETLGKSMYTGLEQMKSFTESKKSDNAAIQYLRQFQASYAVAQSKEMMMHPGRENKLELDAAQRKMFATKAGNQATDAMTAINSVLAQFKDKTMQKHAEKQAAKTPTAPQNGKMMQSVKAANTKNAAQPAVNASPRPMCPVPTNDRDKQIAFEFAQRKMQTMLMLQMQAHQRTKSLAA